MNRLVYIFLFFSFTFSLTAQSTFENRIKEIKNDIQIITEQEKETLRLEVESINEKLDKMEITGSEAELQKKMKAEKCADRIASRIAPLEKEIQRLVKGEVEGNADRNIRLGHAERAEEPEAAEAPEAPEAPEVPEAPEAAEEAEEDEEDEESLTEDLEDMGEDLEQDMKELKGDLEGLSKKWPKKKKNNSEARTTSQFVFAFGLNNLITDGDLGSIENNGIKLSNSRFYEWGWTWKTRLAQNSPLLQLKYGMSLTYNNLRPDDNQYYVKTGNQTALAPHPQTLKDEPYFRKINLVIPIHLEIDLSKKRMHNDQAVVKSQRSFRFGIGGYAGISTRTKQLLEYKVDGLNTEQITRGDYNTSQFVYGLSAYVGYKDISIYTKYDLNPLFTRSEIEQNNISLGLRFDFH